jgi:hypothetical protein
MTEGRKVQRLFRVTPPRERERERASEGERAGDADQGRWNQLPLHECGERASACGESAARGRIRFSKIDVV